MGLTEFEDGKPVRLAGAFQDVTARHLAEETLVISEAQFRASCETASRGIALVAIPGEFLKVNQSMCHMLGYSEAELLETTLRTLTHPADLASDVHHLAGLLRGDVDTYEVEKRYLHKNGAPSGPS